MTSVLYPKDDPKFDIAPCNYPGGEDAYWRDYDAAHSRAIEAEHRLSLGLSEQEYAERQAYFALRTEVNEMVKELAEETGHDTRTISLWLVKDHGFPWRQHCDADDLRCIRAFLADERNRAEAHVIAESPRPRRG